MKTKSEEKAMSNTSKNELERLQKLRAELESRLAAIEDDEKTVEEDITILREKAAVQDLKKKIKEKGDALASLRIEKKELEDKMKEPSILSISEAIHKAKTEKEKNKETQETEKKEASMEAWKKDEQPPESEETSEEQQKKKLRFF